MYSYSYVLRYYVHPNVIRIEIFIYTYAANLSLQLFWNMTLNTLRKIP